MTALSKVLIIEDDPYVHALYQRYFGHRQHDYEFFFATSGPEGLAKAKAEKPTLILLDIMMPGMDGVATLKELKADPDTKDIMVLMLTNWSDAQYIRQATQLGAIGFIMKSEFTPDQLQGQIRLYIQKYLDTHTDETNQ